MTTNIFLTGVTGYIGGDIFYALNQAHPDYSYTLLVRNEERAKPVKAKYPNAKFVYGDLKASEVIEQAASEADIVIHAADSDDVPSAQAIIRGLAASHTPDKPGFYFHNSGAGILTWRDMHNKRYGQAPYDDESYDDITDIAKISTLPDEAFHRNVDKIVLGVSSPAVKTAIVCPPCIAGEGRGPVNTRSIQVYDMVKFALTRGFAPVIGTGKTEWDYVHVADMSDVYVRLVDAAKDEKKAGNKNYFGENGYYFCEDGPFVWGNVAKWIADELVKQGFMAEPKVEVITFEDVSTPDVRAGFTWGLNSKNHASRARKYLDWKPTRAGLKEFIPEIVSSEAARLGIKPTAA